MDEQAVADIAAKKIAENQDQQLTSTWEFLRGGKR
jgi:hypothetical protein